MKRLPSICVYILLVVRGLLPAVLWFVQGIVLFLAQLILNGHRMAQGLHSELLVVNIETPHSRFPVGDKERERVWKNFKLTHDLWR